MTGGFLVVRRGGTLWGLPADQVSGIQRTETVEKPEVPATGGGIELRLAGGGRLAVDAVLTLAAELAVRPLSARLRPHLPAGSAGLALLAGEPLVLMTLADRVLHD